MDKNDLAALRSAVKALIEFSTSLTQGAVTAQLVLTRAMLQSGAIDQKQLANEVAKELAALPAEAQKTAFPYALIQLAKLLHVETTATYQSAEERMLEALQEIDPKKMH
jgi:hypothetical protein